MIIKQNAQYELHATLTPYGEQHSLTLSQIFRRLNSHAISGFYRSC